MQGSERQTASTGREPRGVTEGVPGLGNPGAGPSQSFREGRICPGVTRRLSLAGFPRRGANEICCETTEPTTSRPGHISRSLEKVFLKYSHL